MMFGRGHMGGFFGPGFGYGNGWGYNPGGSWYGNGYGIMSGFNFTGILFFLLLGFLVYLLIKRNKQHGTAFQGKYLEKSNEALEVAKMRYANGEISHNEYQEIVKIITS